MASRSVKKILVVGGGTAGWMTAAYLARWLENTNIQVALIESEQIGTIGVGEATVPGIHQFIRDLDIKESEFIRATNATFKLGIEFSGWAGEGQHFFHPFGGYGVPIEDRSFHKTWWSAKNQGYALGLDKFSLCTQLARAGRFAQPSFEPESSLAWYSYAYHFDASLFAKFLRSYAEQRNVTRIEGKVNHIQLDASSGFIQSVTMESGLVVESDLFIDCTGMPALLIHKTLGVGYEDWSKWLLCDSALAVQTKSAAEPDPFTRSSARTAGWQWHIPLQHRVGNGYVYSSQFTSPEQAHRELLGNLAGELTTDPRLIHFTTGMRRDFWYKNCVAIGLSSGFLEPLESTSISLIQTGIAKMAAFLVNFEINETRVAEANRLNRLEYERVRDFIILHYKLNGRSNPFWQHVREMAIPASLEEKIASFRASGDIKEEEQESFKADSWISMFYGLGLAPQGLAPLADPEKAPAILNNMAGAIAKGCHYASSHADFLKTLGN
ncbi:MAG: tryptophan halogenase [Cellvibrio sp. 79]|nr:MAG: tryptophan halogenase [Cellvibrio sp. 79]